MLKNGAIPNLLAVGRYLPVLAFLLLSEPESRLVFGGEIDTNSSNAVSPESRTVSIRQQDYESRGHFVIQTETATYWLDEASGGLSRLIDEDGNDWIEFRMQPWDEYPASAASSFRGLPNLVFQGSEKGFGHPGWDRATSLRVDSNTIACTSKSGEWRLIWKFYDKHALLHVEKAPAHQPYWFLYEGPIAGRWEPSNQYFATDRLMPVHQPRDYFKGERLFSNWQWAYVGDKSTSRILALCHQQQDQLADTFSHLGNAKSGLSSSDGMAVFGFGRGPNGIEPLLTGSNTFQIQFIEQSGESESDYRSIRSILDTVVTPKPGHIGATEEDPGSENP